MNFSPSTLKFGALASLALLAIACTNSDLSEPTANNQPAVEKSNSLPLDPTPVAKIALSNGNTLEFQDFESDVMVLETGKAGTTPFLDEARSSEALAKLGVSPAEKLSGIWKLAAPGTPMPKALTDIQTRLKNLPDMSMSRERPTPMSEIFGESPRGQAGQALPKAAAPVGCNNGCCDYQWLATLTDCKKYWDYNWFNYNYNWSKVNSTSIELWAGTVCAATGNSIWKVNIDGKGGSWTVLQGHYKTYWWIKGVWDQNATTSVNSSASPALHTYCGNVSY